MNNKKAQAFRNKNHLNAQTQSNTQNLQTLGELIIPLSAKVFDLEKKVERLENQLNATKTAATLAEYRAQALQRLSGQSPHAVRDAIVSLQKEDFKRQSDSDDAKRSLTTAEGPATSGQVAVISGKVFQGENELENEEVIGSKITLGDDDLFTGIDEQIIGMIVGETKKVTFKVNDQEYFLMLNLDGLREFPAKAEDILDEKTQIN
jgi:FKBP-type peptidyl-prolyl cis-trans isomerase (trigger factor)